ncbi:Pterin-4-alpha-carbinolamine dehydratase [hydrothermal vent metagenome]|uniref:4a-hydroxytetrahydrobiopterin dehydratase n=1 Tax=hydrothermal vent metagenome TaxID=652676 RepID=A0A3B0W3V7_9ZZZZ
MTALTSKHCAELTKDNLALDIDEATKLLQQLDPQWQLNEQDKNICLTFKFKNYYQTMAFVNVVAQIAHQQNHHPDLSVSYNQCIITYSTHSIGGLSVNDFICAAKINAAQNL